MKPLNGHTLDGFYDWLLARGRSVETADKYRGQVRLAQESEDIAARLVSKDLSPNSRRFAMAALRAWAKYTVDPELLLSLEDIKLPLPENIKERTPLAPDKWRSLREAIRKDRSLSVAERNALLIIARRGLRVGGVAALSKKALVVAKRDGVIVFESKGRILRYGVGPVRKQVAELAAIQGPWEILADLLVPGARPVRRVRAACKHLWRLLNDIAESHDVQLYPHRFRHTCATEFYKKTRDIRALQQYMQWRDIKQAAQYVRHIEREELDKLAEDMLDDDE